MNPRVRPALSEVAQDAWDNVAVFSIVRGCRWDD